MIFYISFANLKNFGFLRFHQHSRYPQFSQNVGFVVKSKIEMLFSIFFENINLWVLFDGHYFFFSNCVFRFLLFFWLAGIRWSLFLFF
jgi:hypothetical protein